MLAICCLSLFIVGLDATRPGWRVVAGLGAEEKIPVRAGTTG